MACLKTQDEGPVRQSMKEAARLRLDFAPALFVNGEEMRGLASESELTKVIDRALRDAGVNPAESIHVDRLPNKPDNSAVPPRHPTSGRIVNQSGRYLALHSQPAAPFCIVSAWFLFPDKEAINETSTLHFPIRLLGLVPLKAALAQVAISVDFAPPALPEYEQPQCPEDGYLWVPGYWAWDADDSDYYWVPGTWVPAPEPGYLWTPPWWGWNNGAYVFNEGYWAPQVGFYGGVNYGFGYFGRGYEGGRWQNNHFYYNTAVVNVNTTVIRNVYVNKTVIVNNNVHVSYNGGRGGIQARPTQQEEVVARMRHVPPPAVQAQRIQLARSNPQLRASANHGRPPVAATQHPTEFSGRGVVQARAAGAPYHPPANRQPGHGGNARPGNEAPRPAEKPPARPEIHETPARPAAGTAPRSNRT